MKNNSMRFLVQVGIACMLLALRVGAVAGTPDIRGTVTNIAHFDQRDPFASIMVDGKKHADTSVDEASMRIGLKTKFFKMVEGRRVEAKFADLKIGQQVEGRFAGPVAESYTVQGTAAEIVILGQTASP